MTVDHVRFDCEDLVSYLPRLAELTVPTDSLRENDGGKPGKLAGSPAPWMERVANLILDVHAGVRRLESVLHYEVFASVRVRGSSDENTVGALRAIPGLCESATSETVSTTAVTVNTWARRARLILDESRQGEELWSRVPGGLSCPSCGAGLFLKPGWQYVTHPDAHCRSCVDSETDEPVSWSCAEWLGLVETGTE